ncbi:MAG: fluoride efflux transporter CrcB [Acidaminococcaceae bacterium]
MLNNLLAVACGGAIGATLRYWISITVHDKLGASLPYGTFLVNASGCFLLGVTVAFCLKHPEMPLPLKLFIITGFLGGLTTFSTFTLESFELLTHNPVLGLCNVAVSIIGGLILIALGLRVI